jgi:hypothetical protein
MACCTLLIASATVSLVMRSLKTIVPGIRSMPGQLLAIDLIFSRIQSRLSVVMAVVPVLSLRGCVNRNSGATKMLESTPSAAFELSVAVISLVAETAFPRGISVS